MTGKADADQYDYSESAAAYDDLVKEYDSHAHDVIFGMAFEYVRPGETLLDIGIGTGLASFPFARSGLSVHGLDISADMLAQCRTKSFAAELKQHDIGSGRIPYHDGAFAHAISCGVLHFLGDLDVLFAEVRRVVREGAVFAFTIAPLKGEDGFRKEHTAWGVPIYRHAPRYITGLLAANGFERLKEQRLLVKGADRISYDMEFSALVARRK